MALSDTERLPNSILVSASEAHRRFFSLLRQVAGGQCFTVLSHGHPVATLSPAKENTASRAASRRALLARLTTQSATDAPRNWQRDDLYD